MKLYSYVVEHDNGFAPNPFYGYCTLAHCKFRKKPTDRKNILELAKKGEWIVGTGGSDTTKSAGHGRLIYAMQISEILSLEDYYRDPRFAAKKPSDTDAFAKLGDNRCDRFRPGGQVLIAKRFYYFGRHAVALPPQFRKLQKKGPWFKSRFSPEFVTEFVAWMEELKPGVNGKPCALDPPRSRRSCL